VGEARRLRADIDRELRLAGARADDKRIAKYIKRLDRAKRHVDVRLATLGQVSMRSDPVADISLATILADSSSVAYLLEYMERRGQSNLVQFWLLVETLKDPLEGEQMVSAEDIAFIADAHLANLDLPEHLVRSVTTDEPHVAKQGLFAAQRLVLDRIEEHWDDFSQSELYRKAAYDLSRQPVVSEPIKIVRGEVTPLNRSIRLEPLDALIGPEEQPTGRLFMEEEEKMEAIQAALDDTMDDTAPSMSTSMVIEPLASPRLFDDDPIIQQAADGDLHLSGEIRRLDEKIQELVKQRTMLHGFVRRAELTGEDGELRLLQRSLSSIRLDLRASVFQKAQYEHQEKEGRLAPGRTTIEIPNAVVTDQDGKPVARYAVKITQRDETVNTAWVVYRRYNEFFELDRALREHADLRRIDLPGKRLGPSTSSSLIESRRSGLEKYLQALIYTSACDSTPLRDFLSRSSSFSPTRASLAPQTIVQSLYNTMAASLDESLIGPSMMDLSTTLGRQFSEVAEGWNGVVEMGGDLLGLRPSPQKEPGAFTAPICDLVIELLDLDESNWIKRQAIEVVLQQILGSTIER
jgi:sorting nexin-25